MTSTATIAMLGLGSMGSGMARNLASAGFPLRVWNRTPGKAGSLGDARLCATPAEAALGADIAITMLANDAAVEAVTFGPDGLLAGLAPGTTHVGMSTISVALARRLDQAHRDAGQHFVSAPVFGRPDAAAAGKLWIITGGEPGPVGGLAPVFAVLGQGTFAMDSPAQATLAKLIGNFLIAATVESLGEALALGEKSGLDPTRLLDLLVGTLFGSPVARGYGARIAATEFEPAGFAMALGLKDVNLALAAATEVGVSLPIAELARERLETALARGRGHFDWAGFASIIREEAGLSATRSRK